MRAALPRQTAHVMGRTGVAERHLSPSEAARKLGVSVKALRVYESQGLIKPLRSAADWRAYGPAEIGRLHQIVALKRLGLPLRRIGALLDGGADTLEQVLGLQVRVLERECGRLARALEVLRTAQSKLNAGQSLSIDDLARLTKETTVTGKASDAEIKAIFDPLAEKHFSAEERAALRQRNFDQAEASKNWERLIEDAKALMARGDPYSAAAQDLARRWQAQVRLFTRDDPKVNEKVMAIWNDAMADPKAALKLPLNPEIFAFVQKAAKGRK